MYSHIMDEQELVNAIAEAHNKIVEFFKLIPEIPSEEFKPLAEALIILNSVLVKDK